ncbi:hypothetical protein HPP92_002316 [Vanilla planifolia]|uniref:BHLH domain-containing protein n=1 Tax=Vanilla planifolia TaxID=51239 RepID=A0A835RZQ0_VANPL|nr:hypothetical protein HPP92_002316 [Vanilla planifolia]
MALEAVVFPQDLLSCTMKEMYTSAGASWGREVPGLEEEGAHGFYGSWGFSCTSIGKGFNGRDVKSTVVSAQEAAAVTLNGRRKRRRTKSLKNQEEIENQRLTHIVVERNRRRQMNDYLAVLRSIMPLSYAQKGDQASIIGGAINFVKELEQLLQSLQVHKHLKQKRDDRDQDIPITSPLSVFFTFPQDSTTNIVTATDYNCTRKGSTVASVEVRMVENHANLKVLSKRLPKQLLKLVIGLQALRLTILHLNITTFQPMVLYSFNLKVEEGSHLTSVDDIVTAVHQILERVQEEAGLS